MNRDPLPLLPSQLLNPFLYGTTTIYGNRPIYYWDSLTWTTIHLLYRNPYYNLSMSDLYQESSQVIRKFIIPTLDQITIYHYNSARSCEGVAEDWIPESRK